MSKISLLQAIFPEMVRWPKTENSSLSEHTLVAFYHLETLLNQPEAGLFHLTRPSNNALLKFAILIHALGLSQKTKKQEFPYTPPCGLNATGNIPVAKQVCIRMKFSKKQATYMESVLGGYKIPLELFISYRENVPVYREIIRFFIQCKDLTPDVLWMAVADFKGTSARTDRDTTLFCRFLQGLMAKYQYRFKPLLQMPPLVDGHDLIREFGMSPSPELGEILSVLEEERLSGIIVTRKDALKRAKELIFG